MCVCVCVCVCVCEVLVSFPNYAVHTYQRMISEGKAPVVKLINAVCIVH